MIPPLSYRGVLALLLGGGFVIGGFAADEVCEEGRSPVPGLPSSARLVLDEDWSSGGIDEKRWYVLRKKWGNGMGSQEFVDRFFERRRGGGSRRKDGGRRMKGAD